DWSSDVCSSDLRHLAAALRGGSVAQEHGEAAWTLLHVGEEGECRALQALAGRAARDRLGDAADDLLDLAVDDHRVQSFLAAEVLVDDRLGDARALRDLLDRRGFVAML